MIIAKEYEERILQLLNIKSEEAYHFDCDEDSFIFEYEYFFKIEKKEEKFSIGIFSEYGWDFDGLALFEIEEDFSNIYAYLKTHGFVDVKYEKSSDYPYDCIAILIEENDFEEKRIVEFFEAVKNVGEYLIRGYVLKNDEEIEDVYRDYIYKIPYFEFVKLRKNNRLLQLFFLLEVFGFSGEDFPNLLSKYTMDSDGRYETELYIGNRYDRLDVEIDFEKVQNSEICLSTVYAAFIQVDEKYYGFSRSALDFVEEVTERLGMFYGEKFKIYLYNGVVYITNNWVTIKTKAFEIENIDSHIKAYKKADRDVNLAYIISTKEKSIEDFERLINDDATSEHQLEEYLKKHFSCIFGSEYSKIESQRTIKYLNKKNEAGTRRIDILLYNSSQQYWELFELKKSNVLFYKKHKGLYVPNAQLNDAKQQALEYKRLFSQDEIIREISEEIPNFFVGKYHVIIGTGAGEIVNECIFRIGSDIEVRTYTHLLERAKRNAL